MNDRFAHDLRLDQVRDGERLDLTANDAERTAIARRLGLVSLSRLESHVTLARSNDSVRCVGRILAAIDQSCSVTGDPVAAYIDEPFEILFIPEPQSGRSDEEIELGEEDCDVVFFDGAVIDLGTAIADTLALNLDPYPRSAGADAALREAGVLTEEQAGPFALLAKLRKNDKA